jgi:hypothetical protein
MSHPWYRVRADPDGRWAERLYNAWLTRQAMVRPLADVFRRSRDVEVRQLDTEAAQGQANAGFHCEAWFCRRPSTHIATFTYRHRDGQNVLGETFFCTPDAQRYAHRRGVTIQQPGGRSDP